MANFISVLLFVALYTMVTLVWSVPSWVAGLYFFASLFAFVMYAIDKRAATKRSWRISESTLLGLGLAGGWPGAVLAQQFFRHKTSKSAFLRAFWTSVFLNLAFFVVFFTPILTVLK